MSIVSALAVYFIIWWVTLFAVLPFGVRNASEEDAPIGEGHDPGAPVRHGMLRKAVVTTVVASMIFAGVYAGVVSGFFAGIDLPGAPRI